MSPVIGTPISGSSDLFDLTTLERVKSFLRLGSETKYDDFLNASIDSVSRRFEKYMDRLINQISRVKYFDVEYGSSAFQLPAWPVLSITEIKHDINFDFGSGTEIDSDNYTARGDDGILYITRQTLTEGPASLRVTWTGGMAADTDDFIANFPDIAEAADKQVAFIHKRSQSVELSTAGEGESQAAFADWELLPDVKELLDKYRRYSLGG